MQTQAAQLFAAMTALAICYRERRAFTQVLDEVRNNSSDRTFLDRMIWGSTRTPTLAEPEPERETQRGPLIDRLIHETCTREQSADCHRGFTGVAFSRMARATITSLDDDTLI